MSAKEHEEDEAAARVLSALLCDDRIFHAIQAEPAALKACRDALGPFGWSYMREEILERLYKPLTEPLRKIPGARQIGSFGVGGMLGLLKDYDPCHIPWSEVQKVREGKLDGKGKHYEHIDVLFSTVSLGGAFMGLEDSVGDSI